MLSPGRSALSANVLVGIAIALVTVSAPLDLAAQARWRLQEIARVGGSDEGLASFNDIRDLQLDDKGQLWVLDFQLSSLRLFGADGRPIKEVARRGAGPGELGRTNGFRPLPDGRLVARDYSNRRWTLFAPDGSFASQARGDFTSYGYRWEAGVDREGRVVEQTSVRRGDSGALVLVRWSADFTRADTTEFPTGCVDGEMPPSGIEGKSGFVGIPFAPRVVSTLSPTGALWCASTDGYVVRRIPFGANAADRELKRTVPRVPIARAVRDSAIAAVQEFLVKIGGPVKPWNPATVARDRGPIVALETDEQDRLWVLRETPQGPLELDVWDARGAHVASLPVPLTYQYSPLFRIRGDRIAMVVLDADDLPTIVMARIVRP